MESWTVVLPDPRLARAVAVTLHAELAERAGIRVAASTAARAVDAWWQARLRRGPKHTLVAQDAEGLPGWLAESGAGAFVAVAPGGEERYRHLTAVLAVPSRSGGELVRGILARIPAGGVALAPAGTGAESAEPAASASGAGAGER